MLWVFNWVRHKTGHNFSMPPNARLETYADALTPSVFRKDARLKFVGHLFW